MLVLNPRPSCAIEELAQPFWHLQWIGSERRGLLSRSPGFGESSISNTVPTRCRLLLILNLATRTRDD
jgi:hypothetical protein